MTGIYRIRNNINNKCYYGSAKDINRRWTRHKSQLKHRKHENVVLQKAWNKYGGENFSFEIVELCNENELLIIEQKYLDLNPEYNIGKRASGGDNLTNHPNKNEIVNKIRIKNRRRIDNMTSGEKRKVWSRPKENNGRWKGGKLVKFCICGKEIASEHNFCAKCLPRNGENNPFYGKKHSEETKRKIADKQTGKYRGNQNIKFTIDNIEYFSLGDASKKLNIPIATISWRLKSLNKKFENYKYARNT